MPGKAAPRDFKLSVRVDAALMRRLKVECAARGVKIQEAVAQAVREWLKKA